MKKRVLCYEIVCPVCYEVFYQRQAPAEIENVCIHCLSEPTYKKGFAQHELHGLAALPPLNGTRKQKILAQRIRLDACLENKDVPSEVLTELVLNEFDAKFWIEWYQERKKATS